VKKPLITLFFVITTFTNSAFAKTAGSYFGIDAIGSELEAVEEYTNNANKNPVVRRPGFNDHGYGAGVHYNYAFNMNGFFIAPGLMFEYHNVSSSAEGEVTPTSHYGNYDTQEVKIKNRYGIKADVGFDLNNTFAVYGTGGYAKIHYRTVNFSDNRGNNTHIVNDDARGLFYGAGFKVDLSKNLSMNLEYNTQKFTAKTSTFGATNNLYSLYRTKLSVAKLGLSLRF
jgi:opacity protein-like surface antigen